jgi:hypothetical protein
VLYLERANTTGSSTKLTAALTTHSGPERVGWLLWLLGRPRSIVDGHLFGSGLIAEPLDRLKTPLADRYRVERELGHGGMADGLSLARRAGAAQYRTPFAGCPGEGGLVMDSSLEAREGDAAATGAERA